MFSTTDDGSRPLAIRISSPEGDRDIEMPEPLYQDAARAALLPSRRRLWDLARQIAERERARGTTVSAVRIAVWRMEYDPGTLAARPVVVRDLYFRPEPAR